MLMTGNKGIEKNGMDLCGAENNYGLPERLKSLRTRMGMSRKVLGECCGLSKNVIARYENGQRLPSVDSLVSLAEFFDVSTDFLLGRKNC